MRSNSKKNIRLAVTLGDPKGIGPEIVQKALRSLKIRKLRVQLILIGSEQALKKYGKIPPGWKENEASDKPVLFLPSPNPPKGVHLGGFHSGWSIQKAVELIQAGKADALVTGPISKDHLNKAGFPFAGHTEFLAYLCRKRKATMMLANDTLRVTLVTTHQSLSSVSQSLSSKKIEETIEETLIALRDDFGILYPKIALAALNPHAGEEGRFGSEESEILMPALQTIQKKWKSKAHIMGPIPSDTLFALQTLKKKKDRYDCVVCLYHDQGLIPVKLIDFFSTVNITLGLPIIRTSVDHGVGFDIAGKNKANPNSLECAIVQAFQLAKIRLRKTRKQSNASTQKRRLS